jgi:hypothetical protein
MRNFLLMKNFKMVLFLGTGVVISMETFISTLILINTTAYIL